MADRATRKMAENSFVRIMKVLGGDFNPNDLYTYSGDGPTYAPIADRYALDYAKEYGGICIVQCSGSRREGEGFGERNVTRRMTFREFCEAERFMTELNWSRKGNN